jgi:hypothetical protein
MKKKIKITISKKQLEGLRDIIYVDFQGDLKAQDAARSKADKVFDKIARVFSKKPAIKKVKWKSLTHEQAAEVVSELSKLGFLKEQFAKPDTPYEARQAAWIKEHGIEVGSKVKIVKGFESYEGVQTSTKFLKRMQECIWEKGEIIRISSGAVDVKTKNGTWWWPYTSLEPIKKEPCLVEHTSAYEFNKFICSHAKKFTPEQLSILNALKAHVKAFTTATDRYGNYELKLEFVNSAFTGELVFENRRI